MPNHLIELHSSDFRGAQQFPSRDKVILVVGSGQSGCQIADLLADHGKRVALCTGRKTSGMFRSYRGDDVFVWCQRMGALSITNETRKRLPQGEAMRYASSPVVGAIKPISYSSLARKGVQILGSLESMLDAQLIVAPNRAENVRYLHDSYCRFRQLVQNWIATHPQEYHYEVEDPSKKEERKEGWEPEWQLETYLLESNGPQSLCLDDFQGVIWCTGFQSSVHHYLDIPAALAHDMNPRTGSPDVMISESVLGLYYAGFPWVHTAGSAVLSGFQQDAKVLVDHLLMEHGKYRQQQHQQQQEQEHSPSNQRMQHVSIISDSEDASEEDFDSTPMEGN